MAKIQLNGKIIKIKTNLSVETLLKKYKLNNKRIALEYNGEILPKQNFKKKLLKDNDKIEIVHFIGGG